MVFNEDGVKGKGEEMVFVNPIIQGSGSKQVVMDEACLSLPGVKGDVTVRSSASFIAKIPVMSPRKHLILII